NFKHGHYISFARGVFNQEVILIEDDYISKQFFPDEEAEPVNGFGGKSILFKLEDGSSITVEPFESESIIRFYFEATGASIEDANSKLIAIRETVLNYIVY